PKTIPDMDVRVLKHFDAEQEWVLEPGDMLYLPPGVAHDGVALDDACMTWSIGFRAPSQRDMLSDFAEWMLRQLPEDAMYTDPDLAPAESTDGAISLAAFARMRTLLRAAMNADDATLDNWFGQFITEPKPWLRCEELTDTSSLETFTRRFDAGDALLRDSRALLAWARTGSALLLFVNGEARPVPGGQEDLLKTLCTERRVAGEELNGNGEALALLHELHAGGVLHFASDVEANDD